MPTDLLLELCRIDQGLPPVRAELVGDPEADRLRGRIQGSLLEWCTEALSGEGLAPARHHKLLISELSKVATGETPRLMVFMPPGSAKSKYTSTLLPPWLFAQQSGLAVLAASHTSKLAMRFSGWVQRYVRDFGGVLGYGLRTEAKERWETTNDGEYLAAGVGGAIPGFRADIAVIDDPIKGRDKADSEADREKVWDWYQGDLLPRLKPGARLVLMHTRWHEDDLAGRLLATQGDRWKILKIPAVAVNANDPLGRAPGEYLWADDEYGFAAKLRAERDAYERSGASREWASQFQQEPRPGEGALFKVALIAAIDAEPSGVRWVRAWDLAATAQAGTRDPDWTVGLKLGRMADGRLLIGDVVRGRGDPAQVEALIVATASRDGRLIQISLPQDPGQAGKAQVQYLVSKLAGYNVHTSPETGDKTTRAAPMASQCNVGNLLMIRAEWNRQLLDELGSFPSGSKDDQVDALSRGGSVLLGAPAAPPTVIPFLHSGGQRYFPG